MKKVVVYWVTRDQNVIRKIREKFGITGPTSVNGETIAEIDDGMMELLKETERRGFIQLRNKV